MNPDGSNVRNLTADDGRNGARAFDGLRCRLPHGHSVGVLAALLLISLSQSEVFATDVVTLIHAGRLLAVPGNPPLEDQTIVDLGRPGTPAHESAAFALRDAIVAGRTPGPRMLVSGSPISSTGQSRQPLFRPEVEAVAGPMAVCDGAESCRRTVRNQVRKGADLISFYSTGSLLFPGGVGQAMTGAEMSAITETAHALGRRVIADGHHAPGVEAAVAAGVDSVDSIHYATDTTLRLILQSGGYMQSHIYAITAATGESFETLDEGLVWWHPRPVLERLFAIKSQPFAVVRAYQAGIRNIAFASDAGNFPHGDNARDLVEYVKRGIPASFAIRTATLNAAEVLGLAGEIGSIEPGKRADIIATHGDPIAETGALTAVEWVMRDGVAYDPRKIARLAAP